MRPNYIERRITDEENSGCAVFMPDGNNTPCTGGGRITFRESKGISEEYADLDYAEFIRKGNTLTMSIEEEGTVTFCRLKA